MAKTSEIIKILEEFAPPELAENWDNSGWQVFLGNDNTSKVLVCLTVTDDVINQAVELGCNLIVSHHPVIFKPIKVLKDVKLIKAVQRGIQIYSLHTNCDKTNNGTSDILAKKLNLKKVAVMNDFVRAGFTPYEMSMEEFISYVKLACNVSRIKFVNNGNKSRVRTVAVCAGAGADFIEDVDKYNLDAYVTADIKYHDAVDSRRSAILDVGHFDSEKPFVEEIKNLLENHKHGGIDVVFAKEKQAWEYV